MTTSPLDDLATEWTQLSAHDRQVEEAYVSGLLMAMDVMPYVSGDRTRFELTSDQVVALIRRARQDGHAHDPIECGCELTQADAPKTP